MKDASSPGKEIAAVRDYDNKEFFSPLDEGERRVGLRRLDDVLQALEELNLREGDEIPISLKEKLVEQGIPVHTNNITELIDLVLGSQEQFLLHERRTGRRRRHRKFMPTDEEIASVISRRLSAAEQLKGGKFPFNSPDPRRR